ncbi:MAG: 30S ribosomal protein S12 methylthiotransferase RimO [Bacteroidota bacterium]|nr:30S ribosomal protein S12 methylthiotransferase RimO [Bacteroidota bacterium]
MITNPYKNRRINIVTLGCAKNIYDSEILKSQLSDNSIQAVHNAEIKKNDVVVINTCGFINDAKEESIDSIVYYSEKKKKGEIKELFVIGCLSERYKDELKNEIPDVNEYFGVYELPEILNRFGVNYKKELIGQRPIPDSGHYSYLKISDGCDHKCSFCAIPLIKGKHISQNIEEIIVEAKNLVSKGVKEIILIGQDTTFYGLDKYGKRKLADLMLSLSEIKGLEWLRLQYTYPTNFPLEVLDVIASKANICNYIDIPFQHISDNMLSKMKRGINKKKTLELIKKIRSIIPNVKIRSTFIVGFPEETDEDFDELMDFIREVKFDRLGVFTYSHEEDTYAYKFEDDVTDEIKAERMNLLMAAQQKISLELNLNEVGKTLKVIIERKEGDIFVGRTEFDTPEVDNEVLISSEKELKIGCFYDVKITEAMEYELIGHL